MTAAYTTIRAIIALFPGASVATSLQRIRDSLVTTTCHHTELLAAAMRLRGENDWTTLTNGISDVFGRLNTPIGTTRTWVLERITTLQDHRCLATASCTIRCSNLPTYDRKKDFADWATSISFALANHLSTATPTSIVTAVFSVLEEAAATWASGRSPEEFEGNSTRETLNIIISALNVGFRDSREADGARKQLAVLGSVGKTWAEFNREFARLCCRGGVPLTATNHQGFTISAPHNSEACDCWVARLPKETWERMETAFGILSRRSLDFLMEESIIRWPAPEKKPSSSFNKASTTSTSSSSSGTSNNVVDRKVMTQAERQA